jgi:hypothetical protein
MTWSSCSQSSLCSVCLHSEWSNEVTVIHSNLIFNDSSITFHGLICLACSSSELPSETVNPLRHLIVVLGLGIGSSHGLLRVVNTFAVLLFLAELLFIILIF